MEDLDEHLKKLEKYINKRLDKGHHPKHIKKTLVDHGWQEHHIHKFLKKEEKETAAFIHETEFDKLYNLVQEKGTVNILQVMELFKIDQKLAEKWADILKKAGLIEIYYPPMGGDIELRKKKKN